MCRPPLVLLINQTGDRACDDDRSARFEVFESEVNGVDDADEVDVEGIGTLRNPFVLPER